MNIFYLSHNVRECAEFHNDKHTVKMILEYCQLLSTAHRVLDGQENVIKSNGRNKKVWRLNDKRDQILYSATHINHPSAIWCRSSDSNYRWLHSLLIELCHEYTYRYGKIHKCESSGLVDELGNCPNNIRHAEFTQLTPAMDKSYIMDDSLSSYRNYYIKGKTHLANWKNRPVPSWV